MSKKKVKSNNYDLKNLKLKMAFLIYEMPLVVAIIYYMRIYQGLSLSVIGSKLGISHQLVDFYLRKGYKIALEYLKK